MSHSFTEFCHTYSTHFRIRTSKLQCELWYELWFSYWPWSSGQKGNGQSDCGLVCVSPCPIIEQRLTLRVVSREVADPFSAMGRAEPKICIGFSVNEREAELKRYFMASCRSPCSDDFIGAVRTAKRRCSSSLVVRMLAGFYTKNETGIVPDHIPVTVGE